MPELMQVKDLQKIRDDAEMAETTKSLKRVQIKEEEEQQLREAFLGRDIHPEVIERVNAAIRRASELGRTEVEIITFPATYCNDGGRRINNNEPDWPASLEGFAKRAHDFFEKELRPRGYKVRAAILDYPGDMPGTVGLYLSW